MKHRISAIALLVVLSVCGPAIADVWDYDSHTMPHLRHRTPRELILGNFLRHSKAFYEWRVKDREKRIKKNPYIPELYDDLAVAYHKLGHHKKAIELMLEKQKKFTSKYETHANLGMFYFYSGQWDKVEKEIDKAISLDSHAFNIQGDLEKYVVNYLLSRQRNGKLELPLDEPDRKIQKPQGFAKFLQEKLKINVDRNPRQFEDHIRYAIQGVLRMMQSGNTDSPALLEVLGDLLLNRENRKYYKRLAARAYLKAANVSKTDDSRKKYRQMAEDAVNHKTRDQKLLDRIVIEQLGEQFQKELAEAENWFVRIEAEEKRWMQEGKNPDEEFVKKYRIEPETMNCSPPPENREGDISDKSYVLLIGSILTFSLFTYLYWQWTKRAARKSTNMYENRSEN